MTPEVMDAIIQYVASCRDLKHIKITWFGGEPLMAVPQIEAFHDKFPQTADVTSNLELLAVFSTPSAPDKSPYKNSIHSCAHSVLKRL